MTYDDAINETRHIYEHEGRMAHDGGRSRFECPYHEDSEAGIAWLAGYADAYQV